MQVQHGSIYQEMKRLILTESQFNRILSEISNTRYVPNIMKVDNEFKTLNQLLFNNKLPIPKFNITNDTKNLGFFSYTNVNNTVTQPHISISAAYDYNDNDLDSVLAHEMIHYYLALKGIDMQGTHGTDWQYLANQFNTQYGLNISEKIDTNGYGQNNNPIQLDPQTKQALENYLKAFQTNYTQIMSETQQYSQNTQINPQLDLAKRAIKVILPFISAVINALQRCIQKQSLNEAQDLLRLWNPFNIANTFVNNYNKWGRRFGKVARANSTNSRRGANNNNANTKNQNNSQSNNPYDGKTLYELMFNDYSKINKTYKAASTEIDKSIPTTTSTMQLLESLKQHLYQLYSQQQQSSSQQNQGNQTP